MVIMKGREALKIEADQDRGDVEVMKEKIVVDEDKHMESNREEPLAASFSDGPAVSKWVAEDDAEVKLHLCSRSIIVEFPRQTN